MDWKVFAVIGPFGFVTYQTLVKLLPKGVSVFLVTAYALLVATGLMLLLHLVSSSDKSVALSGRSLWLAIGIGVLLAFGNFSVVKALSLGAPQTQFTLIFYVLIIIYGVIFGLLFWREHLTPTQLGGIALALLGMFIVVKFKKA